VLRSRFLCAATRARERRAAPGDTPLRTAFIRAERPRGQRASTAPGLCNASWRMISTSRVFSMADTRRCSTSRSVVVDDCRRANAERSFVASSACTAKRSSFTIFTCRLRNRRNISSLVCARMLRTLLFHTVWYVGTRAELYSCTRAQTTPKSRLSQLTESNAVASLGRRKPATFYLISVHAAELCEHATFVKHHPPAFVNIYYIQRAATISLQQCAERRVFLLLFR
jgi:hypothetical protein